MVRCELNSTTFGQFVSTFLLLNYLRKFDSSRAYMYMHTAKCKVGYLVICYGHVHVVAELRTGRKI